MIVALMSDLHDNLASLASFFALIKKEKVDQIICCGDLTNRETLAELAAGFKSNIYLVRGNAEIYSDQDLSPYKQINYLGKFGFIELDGFKIGLCHEPVFIEKLLAREKNLNFIFYGHTHRPWLSIKNRTTLVNPGTLGGIFQKPSFALWDSRSGQIKLKLIH